jgi:hypothetical protein
MLTGRQQEIQVGRAGVPVSGKRLTQVRHGTVNFSNFETSAKSKSRVGNGLS